MCGPRFDRQLRESQQEEMTNPSELQEIHRVKHGLINAETAMTLAVHRLLNSIQRMSSSSQSTEKAAKAVFYLSMASIYMQTYIYSRLFLSSFSLFSSSPP